MVYASIRLRRNVMKTRAMLNVQSSHVESFEVVVILATTHVETTAIKEIVNTVKAFTKTS
jgi:hypothetical protein